MPSTITMNTTLIIFAIIATFGLVMATVAVVLPTVPDALGAHRVKVKPCEPWPSCHKARVR
jgi:hypothetical protein